MDTLARTVEAWKRLPPLERKKLMRKMEPIFEHGYVTQETALDAVCGAIMAGDTAKRKRRSDARTDAARRVLVGARVSREFAERCREAAASRGLSLYAWVVWALERGVEG